MNSISSLNTQQLLQGLQSNEESQQLQSVIEICSMLLMGNEETLFGFPIIQSIPALINLVRMQHNFDLMIHGCRALAYMLEALPRSSILIVDAVPALLEKLQDIQCIDVAEQSLNSLEILSRRHFKAILHANGISACLSFLDFFSTNSQHAALTIASNCCLNLKTQEFHFVKDSIPLLTQILSQNDKKNVEKVCNTFYRLIEGFKDNSVILQEIGSVELMKIYQQLIVSTTSKLNAVIFTNVIKMMSILCANCPDLVNFLLKNDVAATVVYLLTNSKTVTPKIELVQRSSSELHEIISLIIELLPKLSNDEFFEVQTLAEEIIEESFASAFDETENLKELKSLIENIIKNLISLVFEVYSSSSTTSVRYKCLQALLRMIYFASADLLGEVLKIQLVSSNIANMLTSNDNKIVVHALQMAEILIQKLPDVFGLHFQREGVMHHIKQLADVNLPICSNEQETTSRNVTIFTSNKNVETEDVDSALEANEQETLSRNVSISTPNINFELEDVDSALEAYEEVFNESKNNNAATVESLNETTKSLDSENIKDKNSRIQISSETTKSFKTNDESSKNLETIEENSDHDSMSDETEYDSFNSSSSSSSSYESVKNTYEVFEPNNQKISQIESSKAWIKNKAIFFINRYSYQCSSSDLNILSRLSVVIEKLNGSHEDCLNALEELRKILLENDISSFEVNQSGLISAMLNFLTNESQIVSRDDRLRMFFNIFTNLPLDQNHSEEISMNSTPFKSFVSKLSLCLTQLEQFSIKVYDYRSNLNPIKVFTTHQLNVNLQKHPNCKSIRKFKNGVVKVAPLTQIEAFVNFLQTKEQNGMNSKSMLVTNSEKSKIQFFIGDQLLSKSMTVYQAIKDFSPSLNAQSNVESCIGNVNIWLQQHKIFYKVIENEVKNEVKTTKGEELGAIPAIVSPLSMYLDSKLPESIRNASFDVLNLLKVLYGLNRHWSSLYCSLKQKEILNQAEFINSKISSKILRQLQDPLIIMTGNLPNWLKDLAISCPFLLPFETRHLLFHVTSFDRDRALQRVIDTTPNLNLQRDILPRLSRQKCVISRENTLKYAEIVMEKFGNSKTLLEVQYENEVGTGLGPTLEFYALISNELQRNDLNLWNDTENSYKNHQIETNFVKIPSILVFDENSKLIFKDLMTTIEEDVKIIRDNSKSKFVISPNGLFPIPLSKTKKSSITAKIRAKFNFLGKFMAKSLMDNRVLDLPLSMPFYHWILEEQNFLDLVDLKNVVPEVQKVLLHLNEIVKKRENIQANPFMNDEEKAEKIENLNFDGSKIVDLELNFIPPGHVNIELLENGRNIPVTIDNLHQYISLVSHWFLVEGVTQQFESFKEGFNSVFPIDNLKFFYPEELEKVFCGSGNFQKWEMKMLAECCRTDHGYTQESPEIQNFYEILSEYNYDEQRSFLQFVTGTPRLPIGGFKALTPPLTIVKKKVDENQNPDDFLPSVMTCVNYLKVPEYSSREIMKEKLKIAAHEGSLSFHLS